MQAMGSAWEKKLRAVRQNRKKNYFYKKFLVMDFMKLIGKLLCMLGFSAGVNSCNMASLDGPAAEYGCPHADFEFSGKVVSDDNKAIAGLRVVVKAADAQNYYFAGDTVYTDRTGIYLLEKKSVWPTKGNFVVSVDDVDGSANGGEFLSAQSTIVVESNDFKGGESWYAGKATKTADFKLTQKK